MLLLVPLEHASWVLPAAEEAYKHRDEILPIWDRLLTFLLGTKSRIAITGMPGVGKSVLMEYLTGEAYVRGYVMPEQPSPQAEKRKIEARKKRILITTIPGQETGARYLASDEVFESKNPVVGVIHVVANGFAKIREKSAESALVDVGIKTIAEYRAVQLAKEVEDLKSTGEMIVRSNRKHRKPIWMLVTSTKCDLYANDLSNAERYYSPFADNEFVRTLKGLEGKIGSLYLSWATLPACAALRISSGTSRKLNQLLKRRSAIS
jgi:nucleoside-triphosphatase THEP1